MNKYKARKANGTVSLEKVDNGFLVKEKKFDPDSGNLVDAYNEMQTLDGVDLLITACEGNLADLKELKKDASKL